MTLIDAYRFGAPAFSPSDISGLAAWWKADGTLWQDSARTTPATADSDPVGAADDASASGFHIVQATSTKRPLLKTSGGPNSKPFLRFDGVDDVLLNGSSAVPLAPATSFIVAAPKGTTFSRMWSDGAVTGGVAAYRSGSDPSAIVIEKSNVTTMITSTGSHASSVFKVFALDVSATAQHFFTNGAADGTGSTSTTFSGTATALGALTDGTSPFAVDVCERIIYDTVLDATNRGLVTAYLGTKYGITVV